MKVYITILLTLTYLTSQANELAFGKPDSLIYFKEGEYAFDLTFPKVINYPATSISLSDFKGKVIILYSWTTYCAPCVESFPKLDSIQREFSDNLQIILVGYEAEEKIMRLFDRMNKLGKKYILPNAIVDNALFKHLLNEDGSLGGSIWINNDGKVLGRVKGSENINNDNLTEVLNGNIDLSIFNSNKPIDLPKIKMDNNLPLLIDGNGGNAQYFKSHSVVTKYIPGLIDGGIKIELEEGLSSFGKIRLLNTNIARLYSIAYGSLSTSKSSNGRTVNLPVGLSHSQIEFDVKNEQLYRPSFELWDSLKYNHGYCYELIIPYVEPKELLLAMRTDLDKYFGLTSYFEEREVECLVLTKTRDFDIESKTEEKFFQKDNFGIIIKKQPISTLINAIRYYLAPGKLLLDETGITHNIDIEFIAEMNNIDEVNSKLKKFGLNIVKSERKIDKLIVREHTALN